MSTVPEQPQSPAAGASQASHAPIGTPTAYRIEGGSRGAYLLAGLAVGLLFVGWLAFYFLLFMPRGSVG
jgi:hypothetical protein